MFYAILLSAGLLLTANAITVWKRAETDKPAAGMDSPETPAAQETARNSDFARKG
jgi:hypothetical protein